MNVRRIIFLTNFSTNFSTIFLTNFNSFFVLQERQKNYDGLLKRIEDFEAKERLEKLEANISKLSPQPVVQEVETKTEEPAPKYDAETQANIDNYLQVLSRYVFYQTLRILCPKKYQARL